MSSAQVQIREYVAHLISVCVCDLSTHTSTRFEKSKTKFKLEKKKWRMVARRTLFSLSVAISCYQLSVVSCQKQRCQISSSSSSCCSSLLFLNAAKKEALPLVGDLHQPHTNSDQSWKTCWHPLWSMKSLKWSMKGLLDSDQSQKALHIVQCSTLINEIIAQLWDQSRKVCWQPEVWGWTTPPSFGFLGRWDKSYQSGLDWVDSRRGKWSISWKCFDAIW